MRRILIVGAGSIAVFGAICMAVIYAVTGSDGRSPARETAPPLTSPPVASDGAAPGPSTPFAPELAPGFVAGNMPAFQYPAGFAPPPPGEERMAARQHERLKKREMMNRRRSGPPPRTAEDLE